MIFIAARLSEYLFGLICNELFYRPLLIYNKFVLYELYLLLRYPFRHLQLRKQILFQMYNRENLFIVHLILTQLEERSCL